MKRLLMVILSFIFLGGTVTGSALLLSGCNYEQTETSEGGDLQNDNSETGDNVAANAPTNSGSWTDSGNYATSFAGGSGTSTDPYLISTPQQLAYLSYLINGSSNSSYRSLYYEQTANLDMSAYWWDAIGYSSSYYFSGHYDGGGFTISGLYTEAGSTSDYSYQGLFGYADSITANNINIINSEIQGYNYVGGIVGYVNRSLNVSYCSVSATISGNQYVGGIAGYKNQYSGGTISYCSIFGTLSSNSYYLGGLVGWLRAGSTVNITNSYNMANISGSQYVGGLTGNYTMSGNYSISIYQCFNLGDIEGTSYTGGIAGNIAGSSTSYSFRIYNCYNRGNISGTTNVGGITGFAQSGYEYNCYNTGTISATSTYGAITGGSGFYAYVYNCFGAGSSLQINGGSGNTGGCNIDENYENCLNLEWYTTSSNWLVGGYEWNFSSVWNIDESMNDGLPYLRSIVSIMSFTITYYPNGASGSEVVESKSGSASYTIRSNMFTYTGYNFTGWNTEANGGGTSYSAGSSYTGLANLDLYAQWSRTTYTITYNGNGATSGSMANTTKTYGVNVTLRSNTFTRTGYSFSGWATSANGSVVYANGATYSNNASVTLYAVWVDNINPTISRVTYAQNGGTSYYAYAYASDSGSGLNRVQFPTWTANYDQDDIEWYTGTAGSWTVGGQTYNYRCLVQASNHDNEYGTYITHVYAYDNAGNSVGNGTMTNIRMTSSVTVNPNGGTYNGSSATSTTTQNSGKTLGLDFTRAGYNLSNVTSTAGTLSKSQITGTMNFTGSTYVNLGRTYMYSDKLTWAVTAYMDNWSQYQSSNMRLISCTEAGGFNLEPNGSTVRFAVYDRARGGYNSITTSVTWASLSGWVQFAMVFDGHYARGYIDGELVGTSTYEYTNGIGYHSSNAIFIGAEAGSNATSPAGNYFTGQIRSVHILNEAVAQEDLANLDNQYALYVKGNTTVTASWSAATYTVSYNANGGTLQGLNYIMRTSNYSGTHGGISVSYNATTGLITLNGTVTSNYEFLQTQSSSNFSTGTYIVGWDVVSGSMSATGGGLWFQFKDTSTSPYTFGPSGGSSRAPLYYQGSINLTSSEMDNFYSWYQTGYTFNNAVIRFYGYKQNSAVSSQQITYGTNTNTPYATRTGFYFSGWNTRADGTGTTYGPGNIGTITANTTLYAQWTARNEANYDSAGGYWYVENGKIPQTKVTSSSLITSINNSTTTGSTYYIAGLTLQSKVYNGTEYCQYNGNWYEVEPIRWRLDYSSSQTNGYGTTSATSAVLAEIVYVGQYSSTTIGSGAGYSSTAVTQFLRNGIDTTFLSTYTTSTQTFGNGSTLYGSANVSSNMFVASESEINSVSETTAVSFSDLVKDIIKANNGTNVYFTRDLGSNYNNIVCFNEVGRESQRMATAIRGVQFTVRFTEYGCVA